jgi:hypothetical protein
VLVKFGKIEKVEVGKDFASKKLTAHFEKCLVETLENLKRDIVRMNFENYERII